MSNMRYFVSKKKSSYYLDNLHGMTKKPPIKLKNHEKKVMSNVNNKNSKLIN